MTTGTFISIDGIDGCGKSTQIRLLADWLRGQGRTVTPCRDPGGTAIGDRIRALLLDNRNSEMAMRTEMLLYMASRCQLVEEVIRPALERGEVVVCDRYLLANVAYQGHAAGLGVELLWQVGEIATGGLMPDVTLVLDLDPDTAAGRMGGTPDRIEQRGLEFQRRVREGFLQQAAARIDTITVLSAEGPVDEVQAAIRKEVQRVLQRD